MEENKKIDITEATSALVSTSLALHVFWSLNVFKEAYPEVKNLLTFYEPIGPLLGLFIISTFAFILFLSVFRITKVKNQDFAFWFFVLSTLLFFFMVFPPVFEPIVHTLGGG